MKRLLAVLCAAISIVAFPARAADPDIITPATPVTFNNAALFGTPFPVPGWPGGSFFPGAPVDGVYYPEVFNGIGFDGQQWNVASVWWVSGTPSAPTIEFPLGGRYKISGFQVQADNNDGYRLEYWNGSTWLTAWNIGAVASSGLVTRGVTLATPIVTDKLRLFATGGDGNYAVSEIQAFGLPIPEPGTYLMMLAGVGLLGLVARRRLARQ